MNAPPPIAPRTIRPTMTPTAMPTVLDALFLGAEDAVTTTVCSAVFVGLLDVSELGSRLPMWLRVNPVK